MTNVIAHANFIVILEAYKWTLTPLHATRPGKNVQCSSDPDFAFFKCSSILLVAKLLRKQNNLQILLSINRYEEHFVISK